MAKGVGRPWQQVVGGVSQGSVGGPVPSLPTLGSKWSQVLDHPKLHLANRSKEPGHSQRPQHHTGRRKNKQGEQPRFQKQEKDTGRWRKDRKEM